MVLHTAETRKQNPLPSLVSPPSDFWEQEAVPSESPLSLSQLSVPLTLPQEYTRSRGLGMKFPLKSLGIENLVSSSWIQPLRDSWIMKTLLDSEINPLINS